MIMTVMCFVWCGVMQCSVKRSLVTAIYFNKITHVHTHTHTCATEYNIHISIESNASRIRGIAWSSLKYFEIPIALVVPLFTINGCVHLQVMVKRPLTMHEFEWGICKELCALNRCHSIISDMCVHSAHYLNTWQMVAILLTVKTIFQQIFTVHNKSSSSTNIERLQLHKPCRPSRSLSSRSNLIKYIIGI